MDGEGSVAMSGASASGASLGGETSATDGIMLSDENITQLLGKDRGVQDTMFRVLYSLRTARYTSSWKYSVFVLIIPHLTLLGLLMGPQFPWHFDEANGVSSLGNIKWIDVSYVLQRIGYSTFGYLLFAALGLVGLLTAVVCYIGYTFAKQSQPWGPVIFVAGLLRALVIELFFLPIVALASSAVSCDVINAHIQHRQAYNKVFPDQLCYSGHGTVLSVVALATLPLLIALALANSLADFDPNILASNLLATPNSRWATKWTVLGSALAVVPLVFRKQPYIAGIFVAVLSSKALYDTLRTEPFYRRHVNCAVAAIHTVLVATGLLLIAIGTKSLSPGSAPILWASVVVVGAVLGYLVMYIQSDQRRKFVSKMGGETATRNASMRLASMERGGDLDGKWRAITSPTQAEICSRCARIQDRFGNYDESLQASAEAVLKYAMSRFPDNALLVLQHANFLRSVRRDNPGALSQILRAAKMPMNINLRMMYFWIDRDHKAFVQTQGYGSDGAMDLMSFMEFQQSFRAAQQSHQASIQVTHHFWQLLMRKDKNFRSISGGLRKIQIVELATQKLYRIMLERYPSNVKLLRSYGKFVEEVICNPWKALRLFNLADKTEDMAEERKRDHLLAAAVENGGEDLSATVDDGHDGIVCITETGIIQMTNKLLNQMLDYRAGELEGLNVSVLMPPPFSTKHNAYLRAYKATGRGHIVGNTTKVLAMRRDRTVIPISLKVTKLNQGTEGNSYIGVIHPLEEDETGGPEGRMLVWVDATNSVLCVNKAFTAVTGYNTLDFQGKDMSVVGQPGNRWMDLLQEAHEKLFSMADSTPEGLTDVEMMGVAGQYDAKDEDDEPVVDLSEAFRHKYSRDIIPVHCRARKVGMGDGQLLEVEMTPEREVEGVMVFDVNGHLLYVNRCLQKMLGYEDEVLELKRMSLDKILRTPYAQFHTPLLRAAVMHGEQPPDHVPCFKGHTVFLDGKNHVPVPVQLRWWPQRHGNSMQFVVTVHGAPLPADSAPWGILSLSELQDYQIKMSVVVRTDGTVAAARGGVGFGKTDVAGDVFGLSAVEMVGQKLSSYLDVLQSLVQNAQLYSRVDPEVVISQALSELSAAKSTGQAMTLRASLVCIGKGQSVPDYVPIRFSVTPIKAARLDMPELAKLGFVSAADKADMDAKGGYVVQIWSANWVQAHVTASRDGTIKQVDANMEVLTGWERNGLLGKPLSAVLAVDDLSARLKRGEIRIPARMNHVDTSNFQVAVSGGTRRAAGGGLDTEILVRGLFEEPDNAVESLRRLEALMFSLDEGRRGLPKGEETVTVQKESMRREEEGKGDGKDQRRGVNFAARVAFDKDIDGDDAEKPEKPSRGKYAAADERAPGKGAMAAEGKPPISGVSGKGKRGGDDLGDALARQDSVPKSPRKDAKTVAASADEAKKPQDTASEPDADNISVSLSSVTGTLGHGNITSHIKRAKRLRHLRRLLEMSNASMFALLMSKRLPLFVLLGVAIHLFFFAIYTKLVLGSRAMVDATRVAGRSTLLAEYVATNIEVFQSIFDLNPLHGLEPSAWPAIRTSMTGDAQELSSVNQMVYVGAKVKGIKSGLRDTLFEKPLLNVTVLEDTRPPRRYSTNMGLLSLTERWVQKTLLLVRKEPSTMTDMTSQPDFDFVVRNTHSALVPAQDQMLVAQASNTVNNMQRLQNIALIIAVLQSLVVVPLFSVAVYMHIAKLNDNRVSMFNLFLSIPRHILARLATEVTEADDGSAAANAALDDSMVVGGKQSGLFEWRKPEKTMEMDTRTKRKISYLMAPMILLTCVVFGLHMASYVAIIQIGNPSRDLVATERLLGETAKIRYWVNQMTVVNWEMEVSYARQQLLTQIQQTQTLWQGLLHGNADLHLTGSVLKDPYQVNIVQSESCLRLDKSQCRTASDPMYSAVGHGLGVLMEVYFSTASHQAAASSGPEDDPVNYMTGSSSDFQLLWDVGKNEVADGIMMLALRQVQRIYTTLLQVVAIEAGLMATACLATALYLYMLTPYIRDTRDEVQRVGKMLAMLPSAMNVEAMVAEMLDIHQPDLTYQSSQSPLARAYTVVAEFLARVLLGRRFRNLLEMERAALQQKAAVDRARREKLERELAGGKDGPSAAPAGGK